MYIPVQGPPTGPSQPNIHLHPAFTCPVRPWVDMLSPHGTQIFGSSSGLYESAGHAVETMTCNSEPALSNKAMTTLKYRSLMCCTFIYQFLNWKSIGLYDTVFLTDLIKFKLRIKLPAHESGSLLHSPFGRHSGRLDPPDGMYPEWNVQRKLKKS